MSLHPFELLHRAVDGLRELPGVRRLRQAAFERAFQHDRSAHLFRGVSDTFEAALASAPPSLPTSYDNNASAELYLRRLELDTHDHPAMFWILRSLQEGMRSLVDVGGSVGIKYFAFGRFIDYPADLVWRVIDMPAVAERGRAFAASQGAGSALQFADRIAEADGVDIFYCSGTLQYLPQPLEEILAGFAAKPRRLVINTTPIHPTRSFFTLNSIGTACCPYRVQARQAFVDGICAQGYVLRDAWRNIGKRMEIPFETGFDVDAYSGFCFDALQH